MVSSLIFQIKNGEEHRAPSPNPFSRFCSGFALSLSNIYDMPIGFQISTRKAKKKFSRLRAKLFHSVALPLARPTLRHCMNVGN